MNKILSIALVLLTVYGCSTSSSKKDDQKEEATSSQPVPIKQEGLLNPNMASVEELATLPFLNEENVDAIVQKRPFLSNDAFNELLLSLVGEEKMEAALGQIFLPLNLNTATRDEILAVPRVGDKMAHEFEEYRPYRSIEQFRREMGKYVDDEEVAHYEKFVFVPVNLNTGSKEQILAIPGVGNKMLHEFEEYRPYQNMDQFRREIGKYVSNEELDRLVRYVTLD